MNERSPFLGKLVLEDIFDKSATNDVIWISEEINYIIQKSQDRGVSANVLFTIFSFYAQNSMDDIREESKKRAAERLAQEEKMKKEAEDEMKGESSAS